MSGCEPDCGYLTDDGFCLRHAGCVRDPKAPERCPTCLGRGYVGVFSTTHGAPCPRCSEARTNPSQGAGS